MGASALFSFLARANSPENSTKYPKPRYDLVVFVRATDMEGAKHLFRNVLAGSGFTFPEIIEMKQLDGDMKLAKASRDVREALTAAAKTGSAIVVFSSA